MSSPFEAMTAVLTQVGRVDRASVPVPRDPALSHAAAMRQALQAGPMNAADLAAVAGVKPVLVQSLLKWDLQIGRVIKSGTRTDTTYALNDGHCAEDQRREHEAIALLRRRGYSVQKIRGGAAC
jgi:hypothetical protein